MSNPNYRFMLIDDDADTQRIFNLVVSHHNHSALVAQDANQAFEILRDNPQPDVIVIDLLLPGLDGYQVCERIQDEGLAPQAQLVATTAYHSLGTKETVLNKGFKAFLAKPLNSAQLVSFLEDVASQKA